MSVTFFRTAKQANNGIDESFEVFGNHSTNEDKVRLVYGILDQLLPTVKRELYEDVDGVKATGSNPLDPEESPLLPGSVKMHREANTSGKDAVLIKNHFDRTDFVNMSSEIDLDLKYSSLAYINKSNGMVTKSHSYFSEQLNFGEVVHSEGDYDITMMKISLVTRISLIEINYFGYTESEEVHFHHFVKLVVPKAKPVTFSVSEYPAQSYPGASNSSQTPSNVSLSSQQHNSTNSSITPLNRSRRASKKNVVRESWKKAEAMHLSVRHTFKLFEKKVIGINVQGSATLSVTHPGGGLEIQVMSKIAVGGKILTALSKTYKKNQLQEGKGTRTGYVWKRRIVSLPFL